jgi:hypothetical protein
VTSIREAAAKAAASAALPTSPLAYTIRPISTATAVRSSRCQDEGEEDGRLPAVTLHGRQPSCRKVASAETLNSGPKPKTSMPGTTNGICAVTRMRTVEPTTPPGASTLTAASRMTGCLARAELAAETASQDGQDCETDPMRTVLKHPNAERVEPCPPANYSLSDCCSTIFQAIPSKTVKISSRCSLL